MGTGVAAPAVIDFQREIVEVAEQTNQLLKRSSTPTTVGGEFYSTALANIASKAEGKHEVIIKVPRRSNQWTPRLEQAIRSRLESCESPTRQPIRLTVMHV